MTSQIVHRLCQCRIAMLRLLWAVPKAAWRTAHTDGKDKSRETGGSCKETREPRGSGGNLMALVSFSIKSGQVSPTGCPEQETEVQEVHANSSDGKTLQRFPGGRVRRAGVSNDEGSFFKAVPSLPSLTRFPEPRGWRGCVCKAHG